MKANNIDYETLSFMKKAGCKLIVTGFESVDQDVLNKINKGSKIDEVYNFVNDEKKQTLKFMLVLWM